MKAGLERKWVGWCLVALLLVFAFGHLAWRGPISVRGHWNLVDFASPWASARLYLTGQNPYDNAKLWDTWIGSAGAFQTGNEFWLALMPPAAYAALAPLAALPAGSAGVLWLGVEAISVFVILATTLSLARIPVRSLSAWLFIAAALAMAPMQTILTVGQLSLPVIALTFVAIWLARGGRDLAAGVLLGIAGAIKPQLVAPFFLYYLFFARWRMFLPAVLVAIGFNLLAAAPMQLRGIPWYSDWMANIADGSSPGAPNDPTESGPWRQQMIDLRVWLFTVFDQREFVVAKGLIISMLLAALYVALLVRAVDRGVVRGDRAPDGEDAGGRAADGELLALATLAALTLLPVYHKAYDATLLVLALAWALKAWQRRSMRPVATVTLASLAIFFIPFDFLVLVEQKRPGIFDAIADTWFWRIFIYPHYALATLATALCLLWALWRRVRLAARPDTTTETAADTTTAAPAQRRPLPDLISTHG